MKKKIIVLAVTLFVASIMLISCSSKESPEMAAKWTALSAGVPQMIEALQSRVDMLSQSSELPESISAEVLESVKAGLATATEEWTKAGESYTAGKVDDAVAVGTAAKDKLVAAMESLGMAVPEGMK